jgi:hypothetical protein
VTISAFCLLVYVVVQQSYRQSADDPQIQMANDAAQALEMGKTIEEIIPAETIDIDRSLAPFYLFFNSDEQPVAGSGILNNSLQTLPDGVLDFAKEKGENRVTWQPQPEVRIAAVIVPYQNGYVLAGRNMRQVEQREAQVSTFAGLTWILAMIGTLAAIAFGEFFLAERN